MRAVLSPICRRAWRPRHLVISRSGASTVAELSAIGRPAILVPLPHALDQDQFANAGVLAEAGGAIRIEQRDFTPERLAAEIAALAADPARLAAHGAGRQIGRQHRCRRAAGGLGHESGGISIPSCPALCRASLASAMLITSGCQSTITEVGTDFGTSRL